MAKKLRPSEELLAAPLPELIRDLGLAVAAANKAMRSAGPEIGDPQTIFAIPRGRIELKVAISMEREQSVNAEIGGTLYAFNVNASYSSTYGFKEEASSQIVLELEACPRNS